MITILVAIGRNDINVPCRIFKDLETGKIECDKIFGIEGKYNEKYNNFRYDVDLDFAKSEEERDVNRRISKELFTHYNYGCGGPSSFVLVEIEPNSKFLKWSLCKI